MISKDDLAWLITRLIGVFFGWSAITKMGALILLFLAALRLGAPSIGSAQWPLMAVILIYVRISFYLLRDGKAFKELISKGNS